MRNLSSLIVLVVCFSLDVKAQFNWQTLDAPNSSATFIDGIDGNNIVGSFQYNNGGNIINAGFLFNGFTWTTLEAPGSTYTRPLKISGNKIVGFFQDSNLFDRGFIYENGVWNVFSHPDSQGLGTQFRGIDGSAIVGTYNSPSGGSKMFTFDGQNYTNLLNTNNVYTVPNGITGSTIVGYDYGDWPNTKLNGFVQTDGNMSLLNYPNSGDTALHDIDGNKIVGDYSITTGNWLTLGLLYDGSSWTTLQMPDSIHTGARGIDGNTIVGEYADQNNVYHGFILTVPEPSAVSLLAVGLGGLAMMRRRRS
jgi:hypothetical protein